MPIRVQSPFTGTYSKEDTGVHPTINYFRQQTLFLQGVSGLIFEEWFPQYLRSAFRVILNRNSRTYLSGSLLHTDTETNCISPFIPFSIQETQENPAPLPPS